MILRTPCKKCLVRPSCNVMCEPYEIYLGKRQNIQKIFFDTLEGIGVFLLCGSVAAILLIIVVGAI